MATQTQAEQGSIDVQCGDGNSDRIVAKDFVDAGGQELLRRWLEAAGLWPRKWRLFIDGRMSTGSGSLPASVRKAALSGIHVTLHPAAKLKVHGTLSPVGGWNGTGHNDVANFLQAAVGKLEQGEIETETVQAVIEEKPKPPTDVMDILVANKDRMQGILQAIERMKEIKAKKKSLEEQIAKLQKDVATLDAEAGASLKANGTEDFYLQLAVLMSE